MRVRGRRSALAADICMREWVYLSSLLHQCKRTKAKRSVSICNWWGCVLVIKMMFALCKICVEFLSKVRISRHTGCVSMSASVRSFNKPRLEEAFVLENRLHTEEMESYFTHKQVDY